MFSELLLLVPLTCPAQNRVNRERFCLLRLMMRRRCRWRQLRGCQHLRRSHRAVQLLPLLLHLLLDIPEITTTVVVQNLTGLMMINQQVAAQSVQVVQPLELLIHSVQRQRVAALQQPKLILVQTKQQVLVGRLLLLLLSLEPHRRIQLAAHMVVGWKVAALDHGEIARLRERVEPSGCLMMQTPLVRELLDPLVLVISNHPRLKVRLAALAAIVRQILQRMTLTHFHNCFV